MNTLVRADLRPDGEVGDPVPQPVQGWGSCGKGCGCSGYVGNTGYTCHRSGCGHHYNDHW